jgi:hypothetical protein
MIAALKLSTVGDLATLVAAGAALVTVFFAGRTVSETKDLRRDSAKAHSEQMRQEAELLEATKAAHQQVMAERKRAFDADLTLQRIAQLGRIRDGIGEAADLARGDIANPPPSTGIGGGTWTRVTGALARLEGEIVIYERLGGPALPPEIKQFSTECRRHGTEPTIVVGQGMAALDLLTSFGATNDALALPAIGPAADSMDSV